MGKAIKQALIIVVISSVFGFIVNAVSPKGIPIVGDYSERFKIDSVSATGNAPAEKQRTKEGFIKPVNITVETAKQLFDEGVLFIDGREPHEFATGHIKGSVNIPYKTFVELPSDKKAELMSAYPKNIKIVSYCGGGDCEISIDNAYEFAKLGYEDVSIYLGGYLEWQSKGYPTSQ